MSKSFVLGLVTTKTGKAHQDYSLSLPYFDGPGDAEGCWSLLVSYETLEDQTKYKMRRFIEQVSQQSGTSLIGYELHTTNDLRQS